MLNFIIKKMRHYAGQSKSSDIVRGLTINNVKNHTSQYQKLILTRPFLKMTIQTYLLCSPLILISGG